MHPALITQLTKHHEGKIRKQTGHNAASNNKQATQTSLHFNITQQYILCADNIIPHDTVVQNYEIGVGRLRSKCDGTRAENRFRLSAKRTSPFKLAGASVQSTTGSRSVRISGSNAGYTMFRGSVKSTGYPLQSPVSPSLPLPCVTVCNHVSAESVKGLTCKPNTTMNQTTDNSHSSKGRNKREKNFSENVHSTQWRWKKRCSGEAGCEDRERNAMLTFRRLTSTIVDVPQR